MKVLISGGRVIDPANRHDDLADVFIDGPLIVGLGQAPEGFVADRTIDARGCVVTPGWVDLCARLREPGMEQKATIASETRAAVRGGVTTICMPPDTRPVIDTPSVLELIRSRARLAGGARVVAHGALTRGLKGESISEMAALKAAGCVGVSDGGTPVADSLVLRRVMQYAATFDLTVFLTPADPWLRQNGCAHEGAIATRLGLPESPVATESAAIARDIELIERDRIRAHFGRLSAARSTILLQKAQARDLPLTADVSAHQLFLTEDHLVNFDSQYHVCPPLRSIDDRDALRAAVAENVIGAICSDHQPHELDAKLGPFPATLPGISALETFLPLVLRLVREKVLDWSTAIARVTCGPADILGLPAGTLGVGRLADVCVFDPEAVWRLTEASMLSQGKNTPWLDQELIGQVRYTLVEGNVVFEAP